MGLRVGIVAGEASGDALGAGLMAALKTLTAVEFEGICGPLMISQGGLGRYPMETLAVTGITEVVGRLPAILRMRRELIHHFRASRPHCVIGIDAPDFTLPLERALKAYHIPVIHYVSPTVWAWRHYRVKVVARAADRLLTLFPFEARYYGDSIPVTYVGHPLADVIDPVPSTAPAREELHIPGSATPVIALLPGSRENELRAHADLFVRTALRLRLRYPHAQFVAPFVNRNTRAIFDETLNTHQAYDLPIIHLHGHAQKAMAAADIVIVASGTAALEAALVGRPMIVTYRLSATTYGIVRALSHVDYYSLPNHLLGTALVPELIQSDATPDRLVAAAEALLEDDARRTAMTTAFAGLHASLRQGANMRAAQAVLAQCGVTADGCQDKATTCR